MSRKAQIASFFPELSEIDDPDVRRQVVDTWEFALQETGADLADLPWWPPLEAELDGPDVSNVEHVRAVTKLTIGFIDTLSEIYNIGIDRDLAIAGALLHDCSKLYELDGQTTTDLQELIPHPHFAVYVLEATGCSTELEHVVLAHSDSSAVEPRTIEAKLVQEADRMAVTTLFWKRNRTLCG